MTGDSGVVDRALRLVSGRTAQIYFLAFFTILTAVGVLAVSTHLRTDDLYSTLVTAAADEVRAAFGVRDVGSYLTLSLDWRDGQIADENYWILRLWPPGAPFVLTILDALPGSLVLVAGVGAVLAWAGTAAAVAAVVAARGRVLVAALFASLWVVAPMTLSWVWGFGLLYGDGPGVVLIVLALLTIFLIEEGARGGQARWRLIAWGALCGVLLAGSVYMRWALVASVGAVVLMSGALVLVGLIMRLMGRTGGGIYSRILELAGPLSAAVLVFVMATVPWAAYRATAVDPGKLSWVSTDFAWGQRWLTDADLRSIDADFLIRADANWSCDIDPTRCEELRPIALRGAGEDFEMLKDAALQSIVRNPWGFVSSRVTVFASAWSLPPDATERSLYSTFMGWILLGNAVAGAVLGTRRWRAAPWFAVMLLAMIAGQVATLAVSHVEARYLMPITGLTLAGTALLSALPRRHGPVPPVQQSPASIVGGPPPRP